MWTLCLNCIKTLWLVQEEINNIIMPFGVVEENKQRPVNEPRSLLKRLEWRTHSIIIDGLF